MRLALALSLKERTAGDARPEKTASVKERPETPPRVEPQRTGLSGAAAGAAAGAGAGAAAAAAGAGAGAAGADFFLDSFFPFGISESTGGWETRGTVTWRSVSQNGA